MELDHFTLEQTLGQPHTIGRPFISCYGKQVLTHAIFLCEGEIEIDKGRAGSTTLQAPGLYFYDEFMSQKLINYRICVSAGSKVWILTKSELGLLALSALPA